MAVNVQIDRALDRPLYQQIVRQLQTLIRDGKLPVGAQLPTVRALAEQLGVTRLTVHNAYRQLKTEGWLESTVGRGTFVRASPQPRTLEAFAEGPISTDQFLGQSWHVGEAVGARNLAYAHPDPALFPQATFWRSLALLTGRNLMKYAFHTADVFTDRIFGGNPLAVFPEAQGLSDALMQQIAREVNYSESVFVFPPYDAAHTRRLRIFTPGGELPFAGHPTLGAAHVLAASGAVALESAPTPLVFEEGVGPVAVTLTARDGAPDFAELSAAQRPEFGPEPPDVEALAALLSLAPEDLRTDAYAPQAVSCGVPFLFVPVRDHEALGRIALQREAWARTLSNFWAPHVYALVPADGDAPIRARMFAPAMGIDEDPATGAAASALAGYLGSRDDRTDGALRWVVAQGVEMGRPSQLHVSADKRDGTITAVRVGGRSVLVSAGTMRVPEGDIS